MMNEDLARGKDMTGADDETKTLASTVARQILLLVSHSSDSTVDADACKEAALTHLESVNYYKVLNFFFFEFCF